MLLPEDMLLDCWDFHSGAQHSLWIKEFRQGSGLTWKLPGRQAAHWRILWLILAMLNLLAGWTHYDCDHARSLSFSMHSFMACFKLAACRLGGREVDGRGF